MPRRQSVALVALLLCAPFWMLACRPTRASGGSATGEPEAGALSDASPSATAGQPAPGARPVRVVHAWRAFLSYWDALPAAEKKGARKAPTAEAKYLAAEPLVREYFRARGGGDEKISLGDWVAVPRAAFDSVRAALAAPATQRALETGAEDLARRLARVGRSTDSLVVVFLVGDYSSYFTTFEDGGTQVVAVQLESFVPLPATLAKSEREALELSIQSRPDSASTLDEVMPWAAYASARQFTPELRERIANESASLAEFVLFHGFASRFAGGLYPESVFGRGVGPVRASTARALDQTWLDVGHTWHVLGTRPFLAARQESVMASKLPEGVTVDQAIAFVGARLAEQWLKATRIGRQTDEPAEISRLGRVPTLNAWDLMLP